MKALTTLQMRYGLSPLLAKILMLLADNVAVTVEMIEVDNDLTNDTAVAVHRLRRRLATFGIHIKFLRGIGYWIEAGDRAKIRDAMIPEQLELPLGDVGSIAVGGSPQQG